MESVVEEKISENPDRQGNQLDEIVSDEQLTTYREEETRIEVEEPGVMQTFKRLATPLPSQRLGSILSRSYDLADASWSTSLVQHSNLTSFLFPEAIWSAPQIQKELQYYRFFRCKGVRFSLRANTSKFHYGALAVTNLRNSFKLAEQHNAVEAIQRLSNDAVICSASDAGVITLDVEWACPVDWLPIRPVTSYGFEGHIAKIFVDVLTPLYSASTVTPPPCSVSFFANFIEPEVTGMYPVNLTSSHPKGKMRSLGKTLSWREPSSSISITTTNKKKKGASKAKKEAESKTEKGVLTEFTSDVVGAAQNVAKVVDIGSNIMGTVGPALAMVMDKPTSVEPVTRYRTDTGTSLAGGDGLDDVTSLSVRPFVPLDGAKGLIGPGDPSGNLKEVMSKPGYFNFGTFSSQSGSGAVVATWNVNPYSRYISASAGGVLSTYLQWYSGCFTYWRGSITYTMFFNTSPLISTRLRVTWLPDYHQFGGAPGPAVGQYSGDVVSEVIDVTGDTWHSFTVPYLHVVPYKRNPTLIGTGYGNVNDNASDRDSNGAIVIEVVNPVVGPESITNRVFWHVWQSAGPDFQVNRYRGPPHQANLQVNYEVRITTTSSVNDKAREAHSIINSMGGLADPGYVAPEEINDIATLLKRYEVVPNSRNGATSRNWYNQSGWTGRYPRNMLFETYEYWTNPVGSVSKMLTPSMWLRGPWLMWRGSLRYRFYGSNSSLTSFTYGYYHDSTLQLGAKGMGINTDLPIQAVEIPWIQPVRAMLTRGYDPAALPSAQVPYVDNDSMVPEFRVRTGSTSPSEPVIMFSFGDDIQLGLLYAPPILDLVLAPEPLEEKDSVARVTKKFDTPSSDPV